ncbi:MAG: hypothetical protein H6622_08690, partial [Halobacteriovoraceae bacterium]|nr:hypothetical protein [Halobacteriovoraceae bacterium]
MKNVFWTMLILLIGNACIPQNAVKKNDSSNQFIVKKNKYYTDDYSGSSEKTPFDAYLNANGANSLFPAYKIAFPDSYLSMGCKSWLNSYISYSGYEISTSSVETPSGFTQNDSCLFKQVDPYSKSVTCRVEFFQNVQTSILVAISQGYQIRPVTECLDIGGYYTYEFRIKLMDDSEADDGLGGVDNRNGGTDLYNTNTSWEEWMFSCSSDSEGNRILATCESYPAYYSEVSSYFYEIYGVLQNYGLGNTATTNQITEEAFYIFQLQKMGIGVDQNDPIEDFRIKFTSKYELVLIGWFNEALQRSPNISELLSVKNVISDSNLYQTHKTPDAIKRYILESFSNNDHSNSSEYPEIPPSGIPYNVDGNDNPSSGGDVNNNTQVAGSSIENPIVVQAGVSIDLDSSDQSGLIFYDAGQINAKFVLASDKPANVSISNFSAGDEINFIGISPDDLSFIRNGNNLNVSVIDGDVSQVIVLVGYIGSPHDVYEFNEMGQGHILIDGQLPIRPNSNIQNQESSVPGVITSIVLKSPIENVSNDHQPAFVIRNLNDEMKQGDIVKLYNQSGCADEHLVGQSVSSNLNVYNLAYYQATVNLDIITLMQTGTFHSGTDYKFFAKVIRGQKESPCSGEELAPSYTYLASPSPPTAIVMTSPSFNIGETNASGTEKNPTLKISFSISGNQPVKQGDKIILYKGQNCNTYAGESIVNTGDFVEITSNTLNDFTTYFFTAKVERKNFDPSPCSSVSFPYLLQNPITEEALYNFAAVDKVTCESSVSARWAGKTATCTIGGGCGASCGKPGGGCSSANPTLWGACITESEAVDINQTQTNDTSPDMVDICGDGGDGYLYCQPSYSGN